MLLETPSTATLQIEAIGYRIEHFNAAFLEVVKPRLGTYKDDGVVIGIGRILSSMTSNSMFKIFGLSDARPACALAGDFV